MVGDRTRTFLTRPHIGCGVGQLTNQQFLLDAADGLTQHGCYGNEKLGLNNFLTAEMIFYLFFLSYNAALQQHSGEIMFVVCVVIQSVV